MCTINFCSHSCCVFLFFYFISSSIAHNKQYYYFHLLSAPAVVVVLALITCLCIDFDYAIWWILIIIINTTADAVYAFALWVCVERRSHETGEGGKAAGGWGEEISLFCRLEIVLRWGFDDGRRWERKSTVFFCAFTDALTFYVIHFQPSVIHAFAYRQENHLFKHTKKTNTHKANSPSLEMTFFRYYHFSARFLINSKFATLFSFCVRRKREKRSRTRKEHTQLECGRKEILRICLI